MSDVDWYEVLRVSPTADLETIRRAYRKRATECHPDVGGDRREMANVNQAWFILSNPAKRQEYDAARAAPFDEPIQQRAAQTAAEVKQAAEAYPAQYDEFSAWLDRVSGDFAA